MAENSADGEFNQVFITNDDMLDGYQVRAKIDEGNYGQVFIVMKCGKKYAMKIEPKRLDGGAPALRTEIDIMMRLEKNNAKYFPKFVHGGMDSKCHLLVMDLLGDSLKALRLKSADPNHSTSGTWSRIGIQCLYVLKQMHDTGFLHHDVKPGNFAMGPPDDDLNCRILHLLDFGISRPFTRQKKGAAFQKHEKIPTELEFRPAKKKVDKLRGTPVYASPNSHSFIDAGRIDDVWSLLYMIAEMVSPLPWINYEDQELEKRKLNCKLKDLFKNDAFDCIEKMLRSSNYYSFPNYELVYNALKNVYDKSGSNWLDPYDWETKQMPSYCRWKQQADQRRSLFQ